MVDRIKLRIALKSFQWIVIIASIVFIIAQTADIICIILEINKSDCNNSNGGHCIRINWGSFVPIVGLEYGLQIIGLIGTWKESVGCTIAYAIGMTVFIIIRLSV